jgi:hypothetical protein
LTRTCFTRTTRTISSFTAITLTRTIRLIHNFNLLKISQLYLNN